MKTLRMLPALVLFGALLFTACNKDSEEVVSDLITEEDVLTAQNIDNDVDDAVDEALESRGNGGGDCPEVTVDPDDGSFPRTITVDFGDDGCEGPHGHIRRGKIIITQTDSMKNPGALRTVTFENFYVDDVLVEGSKTLENLGVDDDGNVTFQRSVDKMLTFPNGQTASWVANHTFTQLEGGNTLAHIDDVFEITGGSEGVNRMGKSFSVTITAPLIRKKFCPWIVSGVKEITVDGHTRILDYGDGDCDPFAQLTLPNGEVRDIVIRRWW